MQKIRLFQNQGPGKLIYTKYNSIIAFICTDAWAPICIFLHVSGQNESVHIKTTDTLYFQSRPYTLHITPILRILSTPD